MKELMKGMFGMVIAAPLAGAAMSAVGGVSALGSGIKGATQTMIGGGLMAHSAKLGKSLWK